MTTNQQIREHFKRRALGKIGDGEHEEFMQRLKVTRPPVALLGEGSPAPSHLSLSDMRAAEMVNVVVDPAIGDDMFTMPVVPGKIWRSTPRYHGAFQRVAQIESASGMRMLQEQASQRMRDQLDAFYAVDLYKAHFVEPEALYPEPFPYDEAMNALVGKVRERPLVDIELPIDDRDMMSATKGCRETDGYHHKPYVKRAYGEPHKVVTRCAPFGINTLAPQSGFCSSGVIYGAMPDE